MTQHVWMSQALGNNTNKAAFNYIANLLASEFRALLGDEKPISKRDTHHLISNPMDKKSSAIITKWYYPFLVALANNTDSVALKVNILYSQ